MSFETDYFFKFNPLINYLTIIFFAIVCIIFIFFNKIPTNQNQKTNKLLKINYLIISILFLLNPILTIANKKSTTEQSLVCIIDNSDSMLNKSYNNETKLTTALTIAETLKKNKNAEIINLKNFTTENLEKLINDINSKYEKLQKQHKICVLSDFEFGSSYNNTATLFDTNTFTGLHIFNESNTNIVKLTNAFIDYADTAPTFKINILSLLYQPATLKFDAYINDNQLIISKVFESRAIGEQIYVLELDKNQKSDSPKNFIKIVATPLTADQNNKITQKNNSQQLYENIILDNSLILEFAKPQKKTKILVLVDNINLDFSFFNQHLKKFMSANIDYYFQNAIALNKPISEYSNVYDLIIYFFNDWQNLNDQLKKITINHLQKPNNNFVIFLGAELTEKQKRALIELGISAQPQPLKSAKLKVLQSWKNNNTEMQYLNFNDLPPIVYSSNFRLPDKTKIYWQTNDDSSPLLFTFENNFKTRLIVFNGAGYSKLEFINRLYNSTNFFALFFDEFINDLIYLTSTNDIEIIMPDIRVLDRYSYQNYKILLKEQSNFPKLIVKETHKNQEKKVEYNFNNDNFLNTNDTGIYRISASISTNPENIKIENYYVDYSFIEKQERNITRIKSDFFTNNKYFNLQNLPEFYKYLDDLLKPAAQKQIYEFRNNWLTLLFLNFIYFIVWYKSNLKK